MRDQQNLRGYLAAERKRRRRGGVSRIRERPYSIIYTRSARRRECSGQEKKSMDHREIEMGGGKRDLKGREKGNRTKISKERKEREMVQCFGV